MKITVCDVTRRHTVNRNSTSCALRCRTAWTTRTYRQDGSNGFHRRYRIHWRPWKSWSSWTTRFTSVCR